MTVIGTDAQNVFRTLLLSEDDKKNLEQVVKEEAFVQGAFRSEGQPRLRKIHVQLYETERGQNFQRVPHGCAATSKGMPV